VPWQSLNKAETRHSGDAKDFRQALVLLLPSANFLVRLQAQVIRNPLRPGQGVAFLNGSQVTFPTPIEVVG
jgi:hypothetical protein